MSWKFFEIGLESYLIASNTVSPGITGLHKRVRKRNNRFFVFWQISDICVHRDTGPIELDAISRYFPDTHERPHQPRKHDVWFSVVYAFRWTCRNIVLLPLLLWPSVKKKIPTTFRSLWSINSRVSSPSYQFTKYRPVVMFCRRVSQKKRITMR